MKRRSKWRLAPTARVGGVAGKRKQFRGGVDTRTLWQNFWPEVKLLPGTTAAKTAGKSSSLRRLFSFSLSPMSEAEHAVNASKASKLHVGLDLQSGHTGGRQHATSTREKTSRKGPKQPRFDQGPAKKRSVCCCAGGS